MWDWITKLAELRNEQTPAVLATITQCTGSTPREPGAKMIILSDGSFSGTVGGGHLEELVLADAVQCLGEGKSKSVRYPLGAKAGQCCGGVVEVFLEVLGSGPRLYLFGAGHVGQAICRTLVGTAFSVHVIDERAEWVQSDQIPKQVVRHQCEWDDFVEEAIWDADKTYVAIMTYRHDTDQAIVEEVIKRPARYIGLIGSQSKWQRFHQRLTARGVSEKALARVRCPIGIDLGGGKAPQEVAISFAAELLKLSGSYVESSHSLSFE